MLVDVETERFPFLKFVHEDSSLLVRGKIGKAGEYELVILDAEIQLVEARLGPNVS